MSQRFAHVVSANKDARTRLVLLVLVSSVLIGFGTSQWNVPRIDWLIVAAAAAVCAIPFVAGWKSARGIDVFEPVYWFTLAFAALFVIRPIFDLTTSGGVPQFLGSDASARYSSALTIGVMGICGFLAGYYSTLSRSLARKVPIPPSDWRIDSLVTYTALLILVAAAGYSAFLLSAGGLSSLKYLLIGRNEAGVAAMQQSSGYLYSSLMLLFPAGMLVLASSSRRWLSVTGLAGFLLIFLSQLPHLGAGNRSVTLPSIAAVAILGYLRRKRRPAYRTLLFTLPLVFVFGIAIPGQFRNSDYRNASLIPIIKQTALSPFEAIDSLFRGADTAMILALSAEVDSIPSSAPFRYGLTYLGALARPIPRDLWSAKPASADQDLVAILWPTFAKQGIGFSFSLFGEPYYNFGLIGIFPFAWFFGVLWRSLYEWLLRDPDNSSAMTVYAVSLPFMLVYVRGGLGVDYQRHAIALLPILVGVALFGRRQPNRHGPATQRPLPAGFSAFEHLR